MTIPPTQPWHGDRPPDAPVTVTLPYRTAKRVLAAIVSDAQRQMRSGLDGVGVELLASASDVLGDAIGAPPGRRFLRPGELYPSAPTPHNIAYHAVLAGSVGEYKRWRESQEARRVAARVVAPLAFVASVPRARLMTYVGHTTIGTFASRDDARELLAEVVARTRPTTSDGGGDV